MNVDYNFGLLDKVILNFSFIFLEENVILFEMFIKDLIVYILLHIKENQK